MGKMGVVAVILVFWATSAWAQASNLRRTPIGGDWWPTVNETTDEARQRHSAENYETYKENNYRAPLGGYSYPLGDPAPYGTERPGFTNPERGNPYSIGGGSRRNSRGSQEDE